MLSRTLAAVKFFNVDLDVGLDQVLKAQQVFEAADLDESGTIDAKELGRLFRSLGYNLTWREIEDTMNEIDDDNDGSLPQPCACICIDLRRPLMACLCQGF